MPTFGDRSRFSVTGGPVWPSRALVLVLGAAGLGGQVAWARLAASVVGGTLASATITLSAAMAGLSLGAALGSRLFRGGADRRLLIATVLACAAALALTPFLTLQIGKLEGSLLLRRLLTAALLALAHAPFGAVVTAAVSWRGIAADRLGEAGAELYGLSALGAAAGAWGVGEVLAARMALDEIGLLLAAACLASAGLVFGGRRPDISAEAAAPVQSDPVPRSLIAMAFGLGLLGLAAELLWMRVLAFFWEASTGSYALTAGATIGGLTAGSLAASRLISRRRRGFAGFRAGLALSALSLLGAAALVPAMADASTGGERLGAAALLVGLPAACFGGTFVLLLGCVEGRSHGGRVFGILTAANCAGAAAGPVLLWTASPGIGWPAQALAFVAAAYGILALASGAPRTALLRAPLAAAALLLAWAVAPSGPPERIYLPPHAPSPPPDFGAFVLPAFRPGLESTVAVTRDTASGVDTLWLDRTVQGDTSPLGRRIQSFLGRFPGQLLGRPARRAMLVGLGTGTTLSGLLETGAGRVDVAELSRGVIQAGLLSPPPPRDVVRVHHADGRTLLADAREPYDLILTDIVFPTVPGAGSLFSREFYDLARRRLSPDGLFIQWIPCFQISREDFAAVLAAFSASFPEGSAWIGFLGPRRLILALAGGRLRAAPEPRLALDSEGLRAMAAGKAPIRDGDPRLEYRSKPRRDAAYGKANLEWLLERFGRSDAQRAWTLFAQGGLAELSADEAPPGSNEERAARSRAERLYRDAAAAAPGVTDAEFFLEELAFERALHAGDRTSLERAASDPLRAEGNLRLADGFAARGDFATAVRELERAIAKAPRSADAHMKLAMFAHNVRDRSKAREAFEKACALRPDRPPLYRAFVRQSAGD